MARYPRLILPGVALHLVQRGNNRNACFTADGDYLTYLALLRHLAHKHACGIHAYCLMTNHVHLLVTPGTPEACASLMRDLGRCYVRYFNRRYGRTGTLWEGRFRSCVTESSHYVLACHRYIELNPVRAGMVSHPDVYLWSSYAGNAGMRSDALLQPHGEYLALGLEQRTRSAAYRALFDQGFEPSLLRSIREATNGGYPLVSDAYRARMATPPGCRTERRKPGPRVESPRAGYACEPA